MQAESQPQSREDWLLWRRSGIGGSDAPVVAGVAPWGSRLELYLDKKGRLPEKPATQAMEWGLRLEPAIAQAFGERTGRVIVRTQEKLRSPLYPHMLATLDGRTESGDVVEFKTAGLWSGQKLGEDGDCESLPDHWVIQAQHQMIVADVDHVTFAVLHPALELRLYVVPANPVIQSHLITLEAEFWKCVTRDEAPSDVQPQDAAILAAAFQGWQGFVTLSEQDAEAADAYLRIGPEIRELERAREAARARLLLSLGDAAVGSLPDGREVHRKVIEVGESVRKASKQVRLSVKESIR